ncbi:MAG: Thymidylate kinase [uncultured bacterium]|nr:MAG: Thymidylate kinase [uncultured bacterium]
MSIRKKGKLIVIDGVDGSGKKTQTDILVRRLIKEGYKVEVADFPRYGERSAALVEDYLNGRFGDAKSVNSYAASIFYAVDRYAASFEIKKWLDQGKIVISNRYVSANMGHQCGKLKTKSEKQIFLKWLNNLEFEIFGIPKPDKNILLYVEPGIGQKLVDKKGHRDYIGGTKRDIHEADINHLRDAVNTYLYVAKKYHWDVIKCFKSDKMRHIEEISQDIWQLVMEVL